MPMSKAFATRLDQILPEVVKEFGTPFHIGASLKTGSNSKRPSPDSPGLENFLRLKPVPI